MRAANNSGRLHIDYFSFGYFSCSVLNGFLTSDRNAAALEVDRPGLVNGKEKVEGRNRSPVRPPDAVGRNTSLRRVVGFWIARRIEVGELLQIAAVAVHHHEL